jgi:hypothetical protein
MSLSSITLPNLTFESDAVQRCALRGAAQRGR